ncbi:ABC1 kinase family protein [Eubacterium oxidoreducens]|uniref:Ubiquinone biosynthesis protein n=1 Tax=Eubacterium oxidoreducens TaxID=1732 RepID=A0A1G6CAC4_EUBOX|nr:AarF/UbiB family protein [Eubacterium oxidoreducens]SDB29833.1 ubiquinone biosynthesis protein [Eubacterium oxidoreducens]
MAEKTTITQGGRFKEIIGVLHKHEIMKGLSPEKVRLIIEDLGPTFVKLGQIMSMHSEILPKEYCQELEKLRSDVKPMPYEEVVNVLQEAYGQPVGDIFAKIDKEPLGSASIAQVHAATLKTGERVVMKVQREGVYEKMSRDMALLHRGMKLFRYRSYFDAVDFDEILDEMWAVAQEEMNFLIEASNIEEFARLNEEVAFVTCPVLYRKYTTPQVLIMELIDGCGVDERDKLLANGYNLEEVCRKMVDNYLKQILEDGFFHADPHPGNLRIRDGKIVWIDMGMMGRLTPRARSLLDDIIAGIATQDINRIKDGLLAIGEPTDRIDHHKLFVSLDEIVTRYATANLGSINLSEIIDAFFSAMAENKIRIPGTYTMLVRGLATIEGVVANLAPQIDILTIAKSRMNQMYLDNLDIPKELKRNGRLIYNSFKKAIEIPATTSDLLRMFMRGQTRLNLDLHATEDLSKLLTRLVRDIVMGLIVMGLLIGSSIICVTDMRPKLFGIPVIGTAGYIIAVVLAIILGWQQHRRMKKKKRRRRKKRKL